MNLAVDLAPQHKLGLPLRNPVVVASGFGGYGVELGGAGDLALLGGLVTNPVSLHPRYGAPGPRVKEIAAGCLLSVDDRNPGLPYVLREYAAAWPRLGTAVLVRISGTDIKEYADLAAQLEGIEGVSGLEIALRPSPDQEAVPLMFDIVRAVRQATILPLLVGLPLSAPEGLAEGCVEAGADALVIAAPAEGTLIAPRERKAFFGEVYGPGMLPVALRALWRAARHLDIPLVGRGGIHTMEDALAYLLAGARAIQIDSAIWRDPRTPWDIVEGLQQWMREEGVEDIADIIGSV